MIRFLGIIIPVLISLYTWSENEKNKRIQNEYVRKEKRYLSVLESLRGFYEDNNDDELKKRFLNELPLLWMYCPDEVLNCIYKFIETVRDGNSSEESERELSVGNIVLSMRKDLISKRKLEATFMKANDFKILKITDKNKVNF